MSATGRRPILTAGTKTQRCLRIAAVMCDNRGRRARTGAAKRYGLRNTISADTRKRADTPLPSERETTLDLSNLWTLELPSKVNPPSRVSPHHTSYIALAQATTELDWQIGWRAHLHDEDQCCEENDDVCKLERVEAYGAAHAAKL